MRRNPRIAAAMLAASMMLTMVPPVAAADNIQGHWAQKYLETWKNQGVMAGDENGDLMPDKSTTRAELAVMMDAIMDYQVKGRNHYLDVVNGSWYADAILSASAAGLLAGYPGSLMKPGQAITRQEAVVMMAKVLELDTDDAPAANYQDSAEIASWAKGAVNAMTAKGYIGGFEGKFRPEAPITRAEIAVIFTNIFGSYISEAGTYTQDVDGNMVISADGVTLEGLTISGDLMIAEGVGDGHIVLDSVTVGGKVIVRGGGENSIIIKGTSKISTVTVSRQGGQVRLAVEDSAKVNMVLVNDGSEDVKVEGKVEQLTIAAPDVVVTVTGNVGDINVSKAAEDSTLLLTGSAKVSSITVSGDNAQIDTEKGAKVEEVVISAADTTVSGSGTVSKVEATEDATGATVTTSGTKVENNSSDSVATDKGEVKPGESGNTSGGGSSSGGGGSTGGGNGGSSDDGTAGEDDPDDDSADGGDTGEDGTDGDNADGDNTDDGDADDGDADDGEQAKTELKNAVENAHSYSYEDGYAYVGAYNVLVEEGLATVSGTYSLEQFGDGTAAMNDTARFLGALYRGDNGNSVKSIAYGDQVYTWNIAGTLKGSNWENSEGKTLVSAIVSDYKSNGTIGTLTLNGNHGAAITLKLTLDVTAVVTDENGLAGALAARVPTIQLGASFEVGSKITVTYPVTMDGQGHTITASDSWTGSGNSSKQLLGVELGASTSGTVKLVDMTLDSNHQAYGVQPYLTGSSKLVLENVTLENSKGSGMTVNGSTVEAVNLTISGSAWGQSIDLSKGSGVETAAVLVLDEVSGLRDAMGIVEDGAYTAHVTIGGSENRGAVGLLCGDAKKNSVYVKYVYSAETEGSDQWTTYGAFTLVDDFQVPEGKTLTVPAGSTLTIPEGKTLTVNGTLLVEGELVNNGSLDGTGSWPDQELAEEH